MHFKFNFLKVVLLQTRLPLAFTKDFLRYCSYFSNQRKPAPAVFLASIKLMSRANVANALFVYLICIEMTPDCCVCTVQIDMATFTAILN